LELTIAFGDIREFTRMSQYLAPMDVILNLNSVFEIVTKVIYEHNGDIDKFIGDAFLAVFRNAREAVVAMVRVQKEMELLNSLRRDEQRPEILFRIGVHTGPIIRGNVGGNNRFDNTLIGDTVNTASRLENLSKAGDILISQTTMLKAELDIHPDNQARVRLKGKDREEIVYQVYPLLRDRY
jgi:class 3 adenylate cyclase